MGDFHAKQWEFLADKYKQGNLAHAYLLCGPKDIGKKVFAEKFAEFIGCKFPDLKIVSERNKYDPVFGDGGEIKIAQIRDIQNFLSYKSYNGSYKTVIIDEAEKMNTEAQNCLLKSLEEPKGDTLLFLISANPDTLLPTIFSRCQKVKFFRSKDTPENKEKKEREREILKLLLPVFGATLAEKFKLAKDFDFEKNPLADVLEALQNHFRNLLLSSIGCHSGLDPESRVSTGTLDSGFRQNDTTDSRLLRSARNDGEKGIGNGVVGLAQNHTTDRIKKLLELVEDVKTKASITNINQKLALEILLLEL